MRRATPPTWATPTSRGPATSPASTSGRCGRRVVTKAVAVAAAGIASSRPRARPAAARARAGPPSQHPAGPHRRPDAGHPARRPARHAVAPSRSSQDPAGHWLWFPRRGRLDAAVLPVALDDPHRPVRHADRRPRQLARPEPRRHEHAAGVVARRRLHDGSRRQVPQLLPLGRRAVRPARLGPLVRQGERGRVHGVLRLRGRGPGDRAPLRRRARGLRHRRARGAGAPVRPGRARRCAVVPLLQPERAASAVGPGPRRTSARSTAWQPPIPVCRR